MTSSSNHKYFYIIIILLTVAVLAIFGWIAGNDFINLDDSGYIQEKACIQDGLNQKSIQLVFTSSVMGNWHPLTLLFHMLDRILFGLNVSGHHMINLLPAAWPLVEGICFLLLREVVETANMGEIFLFDNCFDCTFGKA